MGDADLVNTFKLYVRLPVKIEEESQIKKLHPDITKVYLPRQKSRRWCIIEFASNASLEKAKSHLQSHKIAGKSIKIGASIHRAKRITTKSKLNKQNIIKEEPLLDLLKKE